VDASPFLTWFCNYFLWNVFFLLISVCTNSICTGQRLIKNMRPLFDGAVIEPCLLHGDLWSGNISSDTNGDPVILDPASYCK
jgi:fructosamine-3-kinase